MQLAVIGLQEVGMIVGGVILLAAIVWVGNKINNEGSDSTSPKQ